MPDTPAVTPDAAAPAARRPASSGVGVATWIVTVSLLALLPLLAFTGFALYRAVDEQQAQGLALLQRRAENTAALIGFQLASVFAVLRPMAQYEGARRGDVAATYDAATRLVDTDRRLLGISLIDADGHQAFNTRVPLGSPLPRPPPAMLAMHRPILDDGRQIVSPLVFGAVANERVVGVGLPIEFGGRTQALRAVIALQAVGTWLNDQSWPAGWVAAVIDQNFVVIARSREAERFVGERANETFITGLRSGEPIFPSVTLDGMRSYTTVAEVPGSGWRVVVSRPASTIDDQVRESLTTVLLAGVLCALLAVAGAFYLARRLGRQLNETVEAHVRGDGNGTPRPTIREVAELADALKRARRAEAQATSELQRAREQTIAQLKERSDMLDVLAHEVRQPLNNASAALQAATVELSRDGKLTAAEPMRRAELVLNEVQQSIGNTLAVAALLVAGQRIEGMDTDIDVLIAVAVADQPPSEAWRVQVDRQTPTRTASMEPGLMRLALRNLLSNALRCSPPGSPVTVRISDSDEPLALILDVIDHGPGIPPDRMPNFQSQLPPRLEKDARGRRRGLGLHIVHRVMELHGGELQVLHTGPDGTTMRLVITQHAVV